MEDVFSRRLQIAQRSWAAGAKSDALVLFGQAVREEPNNVRGYALLARAYAELFDFERMDATLDKLVRRAPRHPGVHHYVGELFSALKLPDRAGKLRQGRAAGGRGTSDVDGTCHAVRTIASAR